MRFTWLMIDSSTDSSEQLVQNASTWPIIHCCSQGQLHTDRIRTKRRIVRKESLVTTV